ncbi:winged helix-turn-helix domain-containing protein [Xanthomonas theicola]|nr:winged helix-turn-helix domain-containing protein [Xanthomonas theicola]
MGVLIDRPYGVRFSQVHVWHCGARWASISQKPERRAIERDEAVVAVWKRKTCPVPKKLCAKAFR